VTTYVPDDLAITNMALGLIHESPILSMDSEGKAARAARTHYPILRNSMLRTYRWNMGIKRVRLAASTDDLPDDGVWSYKYVLPNDCMSVIGVVAPTDVADRVNYTGGDVRYKVESYHLFTEIDPCDITYNGIPAEYEDAFKVALASRLAMDLAPAIANSAGKYQIARRQYDMAIKDAKRANAMETTPEVVMAPEWIDSRRGGYGRPPWRQPTSS